MTKPRQSPRQDKKKEVEFFDSHIENHTDFDLAGHEAYDRALNQLGLANQSQTLNILDVGCGAGVWSQRLASVGHSVCAIDLSLRMIQIAKGRSDSGDKHFSVVVADIEAMPLKANSFDVCFGGGVLHHFPSVLEVLAEMQRVLKKGGRLCFMEPNGSNPIMRFSYLSRRVLDLVMESSGKHASVNEHTHNNVFYERQCRRFWRQFQVIPIHIELARDPSHAGLFLLGIRIRNWLMDLMYRVLPNRYGCNYILIITE